MLDLNILNARLAEFSKKYKAQNLTLTATLSPIVLYQAFFTFVHDLKSSVTLSDNPQIKSMVDTVFAIETTFRKLAYDDLELPFDLNARLDTLARSLTALEAVEFFIKDAQTKAMAPSHPGLEILRLPYPWESMARARAYSCARYKYAFFVGHAKVKLTELMNFDQVLSSKLAKIGGITVIRHLTPRPEGTDLLLELNHLVALPMESASNTIVTTEGWTHLSFAM